MHYTSRKLVPELQPGREDSLMKSSVMVGMLLSALLVASGCVSSSKYKQAVDEAEEAKARADRTQLQKKALEDELRSLRDQKNKLAADAELAAAELQRQKDSRDKERSGLEAKVRELEQRHHDLVAKTRALEQENDALKKQNESLKATVTRYQKALKEPAALPPAVPAPPKLPAMPAAPANPIPAAPRAGLAPVNVNVASAADMVLFLGISKEEAERIVANRPYKVKQEIVLKNVLPKARFDAIKDRITVAQPQ
jgi:DNA uptake protein ComE-like DNA-binding protein